MSHLLPPAFLCCIMPSIRIMTEDIATASPGGLEWLSVINNIAGFRKYPWPRPTTSQLT